MEIYVDYKINKEPYMTTIKISGRKVKWVKVFKKSDNNIFMDQISPVKIKTSTGLEGFACWLQSLKRKLRKKRRK